MKTNNNGSIILPDGGSASLASHSNPSPTNTRKNPCGSKLAGVAALVTLLFVDRSGAQNIFVSNFLGDNITEFNPNGTVVDPNYGDTVLANPEGLGFDASDNLYVAQNSSPDIVQIGPGAGGSPVNPDFATLPNSQAHPTAVAVNSSGDIYVADQRTFSVFEFSPAGNLLTMNTIMSQTQGAPSGLAIGPNGDVYVLWAGQNAISQYSPNGTLLNPNFLSLMGLAGSPSSLAFDASGNLYIDFSVPGQDNGYVAEFSPGGTLLHSPFATGLEVPIGMAFNASGDLYVVNSQVTSNGVPFTVSEFNTNGVLIGTLSAGLPLSGGLDEPTYIAIEPTPTPEPSTWALLALGVAGLIGLRRRQGRRCRR